MNDPQKAEKTRKILERIKGERGFVRLWPQLLAERDPDYMAGLHELVTHTLFKRDSLPLKFKEIIFICLNAFDYYEYGFRIHVRSALKLGVTEDEILDALEIVGVQKLHCLTSMLPVLVEEIDNFVKEGGKVGTPSSAQA